MKFRLILFLFSMLALTVFLTGCGGGSHHSELPINGTEWTVMVFLNADNNLESYSIDNVNQMEKVGSSNRVKIVVQWDRSPGESTADGNWTGTHRYEITKDTTGSITSPILQDMGEVDMGDPQAMKDFISWAQQNYPAKHYCLVVWNHGSGWRSVRPSVGVLSRDVSFDDTSGTGIRTEDLPNILQSAPHPIDLVAMDASLMQMVEVAYELQGTTGFLVGSEESPPGEGYVYDAWLRPLASNPTMSAFNLGKTITDTYANAYAGSYAVTESVVDLSRIGQVGIALDDFAGALIPYTASNADALRTIRQRDAQQYAYDDYKDLLDYAQRVRQAVRSTGVDSAYTALSDAVNRAVVHEAHTGTSVQNSHGLSVWVPDPSTYTMYRNRYSILRLSEDTRWDDFLAAQEQ